MKTCYYLTEKEIDMAKKLYYDGYIINDVAMVLGVSHSTAKKVINPIKDIYRKEHRKNRAKFMKEKKYKKRQNCTHKLRENVARDYLLGVPCAKIMRRYDISQGTFYTALHIYAKEKNMVIYKRSTKPGESPIYGDNAMSIETLKREKLRTKLDIKPSTTTRKTKENGSPKHFKNILNKNTDAYWDLFLSDICENPYR